MKPFGIFSPGVDMDEKCEIISIDVCLIRTFSDLNLS